MKNIGVFCFILFSVHLVAQQPNRDTTSKSIGLMNAIMITPLGNFLTDNRSSFYYRRTVFLNETQKINLRAGSELMNSWFLENEWSEARYRAMNIKAGVEFEKVFKKSSIYFGPEIGFTYFRSDEFSIFPNENALFSVNSISASETFSDFEYSTINIFSLVGFVGFRYQLTDHIALGFESAIGVGWFTAKEFSKEFDFSALLDEERQTGQIVDLAINRFVSLEYRF